MLRLFLNIPPSVHLVLLVLIPLLRIPSFQTGFYLPEESMLVLLGKHLAEGGTLYIDTWYAGPPVLPWLYMILHFIFGDWTLMAVRVLTCLYLYLTTVALNGILIEYKIFRGYNGFSAILFVLLTSIPWYTQQMSGPLFILLPVILSCSNIMQLGDNRLRNFQLMFVVGIWMCLSLLVIYKAMFILLGILVAYLRIRRPRLDEIVAFIGGILSFLLFVCIILYFNDSWEAFWDLGVLYYADRLGFGGTAVYPAKVSETLQALLLIWGPILLLALIGFLHFRLRYFSYVVKIRATETIMSLWVLGVGLLLMVKWQRQEWTDWILLAPPIAFYVRKTLDFPLIQRLKWVLLTVIVLLPLFLYLNLWNIRYPSPGDALQPTQEDTWLHGGTWELLRGEGLLIDWLEAQPSDNSLWIMEYRPEYLLYLGRTPPMKYTDYRMLYHKFPLLQPEHLCTWSQLEPERIFFEQFSSNPPDIIVDPMNTFPLLQERFPGLLGRYVRQELVEKKPEPNQRSRRRISIYLSSP